MDWFQPALTWYLTTSLIALAVAPLIFLLFSHVTDRGASLLRPIGLLLVVWPVWLLASLGDGLVPFDGISLWVTTALVALVCWGIGVRAGALRGSSLMHLALAEAGHLAVFGIYLFLRGFVPGVGGPNVIDQEKPMDLMMLSSAMKATSMPPSDAWLSGEPVNYYYLGYTLWAGIGEMIGTTPAIAYNLAVASIFAMTVVGVLGTIANIVSQFASMTAARVAGLLGVAFVVLIGNPWAAAEVIRDFDAQWRAFPFEGIMWNATRIIAVTPQTDAISEFPAFSFIFADLHPHLMAIPYGVTALGIAWMFASIPERTTGVIQAARLAIAGLTGVALYAINSWDFPTWFGVIVLGILISPGFRTVTDHVVGIVGALVVGILAWSPFILSFEAPVRSGNNAFANALSGLPVLGDVISSFAAVSGERTSIADYVSIFGFFYPVILIAIIVALVSTQAGESDPLVTRLALVSAVILVAIGLLLPAPLVILLGLPLLAGLIVILRSTSVTLELLVVGLGTLGLALTLIPEFIYLLDAFGTRMNTIFKLYLQAWILCAVSTTLGLVYLWQRLRVWQPGQLLVALAAATIVICGLTYPIVAASQWPVIKNPDLDWEGIDGLAWLEKSSAADPATARALEWLWENGTNEDVLLSAGGCAYFAPVAFPSAASGVPAIIGWDNHERQWHLGDEEIAGAIVERVAAVNDLFARPTDAVLDEYGVTLIVVGRPEAQGVSGLEPSPSCSPGPFPETASNQFPGPGWAEVFSEDGVRIYRRDTGD